MARSRRKDPGPVNRADEDGSGKAHARGRRPKGLIWTGSISFGLVNIPVSLHSGENAQELHFSLLDRRDKSPVGYKKVNKATGEDVPKEEIIKGWKTGPDQYVTLDEDDFKRASPEKTQRIDIAAFVDPAQIDPAFFDRPYYLEPAAKADKAYALLREAMRRTRKAGIATVVLRARQYLCAVMVRGDALCLELLRYASELRDPSDLRVPDADVKRLKVSEAELKMAERLIEDLEAPWEPERYRDEYREELMAFIERKAKEGKVETAPQVEEAGVSTPPADIMALLKRSIGRKEDAAHGSRPQLH